MEIGLIEIGLKQLLARKICKYVDQIDKITCSVVNIEQKVVQQKNAEADKTMVQKSKSETWNMKVVQK